MERRLFSIIQVRITKHDRLDQTIPSLLYRTLCLVLFLIPLHIYRLRD